MSYENPNFTSEEPSSEFIPAQTWQEAATVYDGLAKRWSDNAGVIIRWDEADNANKIDIDLDKYNMPDNRPGAAELLVIAAAYKSNLPENLPDGQKERWKVLDKFGAYISGHDYSKEPDDLKGNGIQMLVDKLRDGNQSLYALAVVNAVLEASSLMEKALPDHPSAGLSLDYANEKMLRASNRLRS